MLLVPISWQTKTAENMLYHAEGQASTNESIRLFSEDNLIRNTSLSKCAAGNVMNATLNTVICIMPNPVRENITITDCTTTLDNISLIVYCPVRKIVFLKNDTMSSKYARDNMSGTNSSESTKQDAVSPQPESQQGAQDNLIPSKELQENEVMTSRDAPAEDTNIPILSTESEKEGTTALQDLCEIMLCLYYYPGPTDELKPATVTPDEGGGSTSGGGGGGSAGGTSGGTGMTPPPSDSSRPVGICFEPDGVWNWLKCGDPSPCQVGKNGETVAEYEKRCPNGPDTKTDCGFTKTRDPVYGLYETKEEYYKRCPQGPWTPPESDCPPPRPCPPGQICAGVCR